MTESLKREKEKKNKVITPMQVRLCLVFCQIGDWMCPWVPDEFLSNHILKVTFLGSVVIIPKKKENCVGWSVVVDGRWATSWFVPLHIFLLALKYFVFHPTTTPPPPPLHKKGNNSCHCRGVNIAILPQRDHINWREREKAHKCSLIAYFHSHKEPY